MQYLICKWQEEAFALDTHTVLELVRMVQVTRLPSDSQRMDGLVNYRGRMIPVLDGCRLFQRPSIPYSSDSLLIVMQQAEQLVAVAAHEMLDLHEVSATQVERYQGLAGDPFDAALRLGEQIVPVLNLERLRSDAQQTLQALAQIKE
ncbi:MAG: chemotaxis protein CheW [Candidatus Sericytochromatia bacterium]